MMTHRTKIRRHLRSARVAALSPEERRDELRAAAERCEEEHGRAPQADADPAGAIGGEIQDPEPGSHAI